MTIQTLTITHETTSNGRLLKSRRFQATLINYLTADAHWELGQSGSSDRPVWITYAAPHEMARAFTANLRAGRRAHPAISPRNIELPKSARHRWLSHRCSSGATLTTAFLADFFELEPGEPSERITFILMPPCSWLERQAEALDREFHDDALDVAQAALFAAFIDRRSPLPLVHDLRFQLQLYRAALEEPWTQEPLPARSPGLWSASPKGTAACGLASPRLIDVSHSDFESFLKLQTADFFRKEIARGTSSFSPDSRLLPYPAHHPQQLCLDLAVA